MRQPLVAREARPDGDVALARADALEQQLQLRRRVLAVGVDASAQVVAVREGVVVSGRDPCLETPIHPEREHLCAVLARNVGGPVRRAVVHDEDVRL